MKKNIAILILFLISIAALTYGYVRSLQAEQIRTLAEENAKKAVEAREEAERLRKIAEQQQAMAMFEAQRAMEALKTAEELLAKSKNKK